MFRISVSSAENKLVALLLSSDSHQASYSEYSSLEPPTRVEIVRGNLGSDPVKRMGVRFGLSTSDATDRSPRGMNSGRDHIRTDCQERLNGASFRLTMIFRISASYSDPSSPSRPLGGHIRAKKRRSTRIRIFPRKTTASVLFRWKSLRKLKLDTV